MITVRLKGGLGNQMFQYAFARGMADRLNTTMKLDCSLLLDRARAEQVVYRGYDLDVFDLNGRFVIDPSFLSLLYRIRSARLGKFFRKYSEIGLDFIKEPHFHVDETLLENPRDRALYEGWWQSPYYFNHITDLLKRDFRIRQEVPMHSLELLKEISTSNSVCLNVRRQDFINNPTLNTTDLSYFVRSVSHMKKSLENPYFFIFSDDIEWCVKKLRLDQPYRIVGHEHKGFKFGNYLRLMSQCNHFIIPNSSFAWWAVWLCQNENKKVVAPKKWFNSEHINTRDLVPNDWTQL